jgi:hypothetical protein
VAYRVPQSLARQAASVIFISGGLRKRARAISLTLALLHLAL